MSAARTTRFRALTPAQAAELAERSGRVVPDGHVAGPAGLVLDADQVQPLAAPPASGADVQAGVSHCPGGRLGEALAWAQIGPRQAPADGEHLEGPARRGPRLRVEPEHGGPRTQLSGRSPSHGHCLLVALTRSGRSWHELARLRYPQLTFPLPRSRESLVRAG